MRILSFVFLLYYLGGTFLLPSSDFARLMDLPQMYDHCKSHEDADMTPLDFITDHLLNIDGIFDKHENGDDQKPHTPIACSHQSNINLFSSPIKDINFRDVIIISELKSVVIERYFVSDFFSEIFRPPIQELYS